MEANSRMQQNKLTENRDLQRDPQNSDIIVWRDRSLKKMYVHK